MLRGLARIVSIHAPRCRRAMHRCDRSGGAESRFQSTPLVVEGRCLSPAVRTSPSCCFNPRPSLSKGDASSGSPGRQPRHSFNPRPSLSKGDAYFDRPKVRRMEEFQSTPLVVEGRCSTRLACSRAAVRFESTRLVVGRRCARGATRSSGRRSSFNPRPSLSKGDALMGPTIDAVLGLVSIHAPRCRRAMPL